MYINPSAWPCSMHEVMQNPKSIVTATRDNFLGSPILNVFGFSHRFSLVGAKPFALVLITNNNTSFPASENCSAKPVSVMGRSN